MILTLDLGNTNLFVGVYHNNKLIATYRTYSDKTKSSDGYKEILSNFLKSENINLNDFEGAILSSVIPSLSKAIVTAVEKLLHVKCLSVGSKIKSGLSIRIDNPNELGADLVSDSIGALNKYKAPILIIDLGTATKYLHLDKEGNFQGCVITSGIKLGVSALAKNAALLMEIDYEAPKKIIGKNSRDSLNSGAIYATVAQIKELSNMIEKEVGYKMTKIITGGNSFLVKDFLTKDYIFEEYLILDGLLAIYKRNAIRG